MELAKEDRARAEKEVLRPWGSYRSLLLADGHQIKEIFVNPGQRLSLQSHHQRSEALDRGQSLGPGNH